VQASPARIPFRSLIHLRVWLLFLPGCLVRNGPIDYVTASREPRSIFENLSFAFRGNQNISNSFQRVHRGAKRPPKGHSAVQASPARIPFRSLILQRVRLLFFRRTFFFLIIYLCLSLFAEIRTYRTRFNEFTEDRSDPRRDIVQCRRSPARIPFRSLILTNPAPFFSPGKYRAQAQLRTAAVQASPARIPFRSLILQRVRLLFFSPDILFFNNLSLSFAFRGNQNISNSFQRVHRGAKRPPKGHSAVQASPARIPFRSLILTNPAPFFTRMPCPKRTNRLRDRESRTAEYF